MRRPAPLPVLALLFLLQSVPAHAERRVSEEAVLFRKLRDGVVTVSGDEGRGSGFLVDSTGIILTNDHVVGGSSRIRVKINDSLRVEARLLATHPKKDVAAIQISPALARRLPVLPLASPGDSMVFEGEKVIALGSPLNQEKIMTSGIVSKVEATALISDVNINHGNSGGPLVNMDGRVIAINTFGDFTSAGGPGVSGSILISEALPVLAEARSKLGSAPEPTDSLLPVAPRTPFPIDSLQVVAGMEKFDEKPYLVSKSADTGKFVVQAVTPVYDIWRTERYRLQLSKKMKKREKKGGVSASESYDPARQMREWMRYTGDSYAALVTLEMAPEVGETKGSFWGNFLGAVASGASGTYYRGSHRYEFKADFRDVEVYRNGKPVPDVERSKSMVPLAFASSDWNADYSGEDMARVGIFQCTSEWFAPDSTGPPVISVKITSVEKPDKPYTFNLSEKTVRRVWDDFATYRHRLEAPEKPLVSEGGTPPSGEPAPADSTSTR